MVSKITYFFEYFKYLKNPIQCLFFKFGFKKSINVAFKNNNTLIQLTDVRALDKLMSFVRNEGLTEVNNDISDIFKIMDIGDEIIDIRYGIKIFNPKYYGLNDVFVQYYRDYYSDFDIICKNKVIVDIGANAGDSALYFASKGAIVYGFEPVKPFYEMSLRNRDLNPNLKDKIKIFNNAVSYKKGKLNVQSMDSTSRYISSEDSYEVDVISMEDILNKISPNILKMDCEGCEFEIIENCDLSMFDEIIFEHHALMVGKDYRILVDKLKTQGFNNFKVAEVFTEDINDYALIHAYK